MLVPNEKLSFPVSQPIICDRILIMCGSRVILKDRIDEIAPLFHMEFIGT